MAAAAVDVSRFKLRSDLPVHRQVAAYFKTMIALGHLAPGGELPPLSALASRFRVSTSHVRRAFHELSERGLLSAEGGSWKAASGDIERETLDQLRDAVAQARRAGLPSDRLRALFERALGEE
jgi:DNA-binding transcriptional regulator YhcF (GntR family)